MGKIFKINCRKLYETALYLDRQVEELKANIADMKKITEDIKTSWNGMDYNNFCSNFTSYLNSITAIEDELNEKSATMKNVAKKHNSIDDNLMKNAKILLNLLV